MTVIFAQINDSNLVINTTIWEDSILGDPASEENGKNYLANFFSVPADKFVQSFSDGTRKQFGSVNFTWDPANNVFIEPKPFDSWTLDGNYDWQPPVADPNTEGYNIAWNESAVTWNALKTADNSKWIWNTATNQWDSV